MEPTPKRGKIGSIFDSKNHESILIAFSYVVNVGDVALGPCRLFGVPCRFVSGVLWFCFSLVSLRDKIPTENHPEWRWNSWPAGPKSYGSALITVLDLVNLVSAVSNTPDSISVLYGLVSGVLWFCYSLVPDRDKAPSENYLKWRWNWCQMTPKSYGLTITTFWT